MASFDAQTLLGELVFLRPLRAADSGIFFEALAASRESLREFLPWTCDMKTEKEAKRHIETYAVQAELENGGAWGIFEKASGNFAGTLYVHWVSEENSSAQLGYWLAETATGKGFATEAVKLVSKTLLLKWQLNRVEAIVPLENAKSLAVMRRAGFASEGVSREYACLHGRFHDCERFALLRRDLEAGG